MAKEKPEDVETTPAEAPAPEAQAPAPRPQPQQQRVHIEIDDAKAIASYSNFCRVMGTPEELIIDFGLNPQPLMGAPPEKIVITQRLVTNYYTAKRLLHALQMMVQQHETAFGVLETDVQKRVRPGIMQPR